MATQQDIPFEHNLPLAPLNAFSVLLIPHHPISQNDFQYRHKIITTARPSRFYIKQPESLPSAVSRADLACRAMKTPSQNKRTKPAFPLLLPSRVIASKPSLYQYSFCASEQACPCPNRAPSHVQATNCLYTSSAAIQLPPHPSPLS